MIADITTTTQNATTITSLEGLLIFSKSGRTSLRNHDIMENNAKNSQRLQILIHNSCKSNRLHVLHRNWPLQIMDGLKNKNPPGLSMLLGIMHTHLGTLIITRGLSALMQMLDCLQDFSFFFSFAWNLIPFIKSFFHATPAPQDIEFFLHLWWWHNDLSY